jgi:hypothetical protein
VDRAGAGSLISDAPDARQQARQGFYSDLVLPRLCDLTMRNKQLVPFDAGDPDSIVAVDLVDLHLEHGLRMAPVDADHPQAKSLKLGP